MQKSVCTREEEIHIYKEQKLEKQNVQGAKPEELPLSSWNHDRKDCYFENNTLSLPLFQPKFASTKYDRIVIIAIGISSCA